MIIKICILFCDICWPNGVKKFCPWQNLTPLTL
jgi:hypothetical protein